MENRETSLAAFSRLVMALGPYLEDVVVIGGWAHRLFALRHRSEAFNFSPLATDDADIGLPLDLRVRDRKLDELLRSQGFKETLSSQEDQLLCRYQLGPERGGFQIEFLTPLQGSSHSRDGTPKLVSTVAGAKAQRLRYLDILLVHPWQVVLSEKDGFEFAGQSYTVRIPNPASWLMQKLLVLPRRRPDDRAKDILYVHDTLLLFSDGLNEIVDCCSMLKAGLPPGTLRRVGERIDRYFPQEDPPGDHLIEAHLIARSVGRPSPPSAEEISARCRQGLLGIFSS